MATVEVSRETLAEDLKPMLEGKLEPEQIDAVTASVLAAQTGYAAHGSIASLLFYMKIQVQINGGETFDGNAGGIASLGGGALFGTVYTDDINRLYSSTVSFAYTATPVYFAVYFFDSSSNLLGTFQAGAVSIVTGTGGGKGSWS